VNCVLQADDAGLADTKDKEKAERTPVGPQHVLRWFGEVATHVKTQVDKVGLVNSLAPCGLVSDPSSTLPCTLYMTVWLLLNRNRAPLSDVLHMACIVVFS